MLEPMTSDIVDVVTCKAVRSSTRQTLWLVKFAVRQIQTDRHSFKALMKYDLPESDSSMSRNSEYALVCRKLLASVLRRANVAKPLRVSALAKPLRISALLTSQHTGGTSECKPL